MMKLYKYRNGNENDLRTLFSHGIWIPFVNQLNDVQDISFYCGNLTADLADKYMEFIYNSGFGCGCLSFSLRHDNKLLWQFYANNYKGFVLEYEKDEIENNLKEKGIIFCDSQVKYSDVKVQDFSEEFDAYCKGAPIETYINWEMLFSKDKIWSNEEEYRFSIPADFFDKYRKSEEFGALLDGILPTKIILGSFVEQNNEFLLKQFAIQNKIPITKMVINFRDKYYSLYETPII